MGFMTRGRKSSSVDELHLSALRRVSLSHFGNFPLATVTGRKTVAFWNDTFFFNPGRGPHSSSTRCSSAPQRAKFSAGADDACLAHADASAPALCADVHARGVRPVDPQGRVHADDVHHACGRANELLTHGGGHAGGAPKRAAIHRGPLIYRR